MIVSSVYITYQYNTFRSSSLFDTSQRTNILALFKGLWATASDHKILTTLIIILIALILVGYFITPPVFKGTLITALHNIKNDQPLKGSMEVGIRNFFPIFEFSLLTGAFSITTLLTEANFILRWWGEKVLLVALTFLLFIAMVGLIINFLFTYTEYFIVLQKKPLIRSIMDSSILVVANLRKTILVFVLMLLIGARIILNVLLVLLIPMLVVFLMTYFATFFSSGLGLVLIGLFGLTILIVSSYLLGLFQIFATAVWVLTFEELTSDKPEEIVSEQIERQPAD